MGPPEGRPNLDSAMRMRASRGPTRQQPCAATQRVVLSLLQIGGGLDRERIQAC